MSSLPSHLELVQGVVLPKPVGAHPVLDFVNTRSEWTTRGPARTEWLTSYEAFLIWNSYVGLLPPATVFRLIERAGSSPTELGRRLRTTLDFRSELYDVLTGQATDHTFAAAARLIEKASGRRQLVRSEAGPAWELPEDLELPLHNLAWLAGELLTGSSREHVRTCPSCGWLFLDARGRRRWCSMATCGNRAKVRAHAARAR
ncbi:putative stress-induced transcription regulator [Kribbella sp. VKM Ac-2571]|uniref:CGNR zinc finger domain-containing protein n=1 Tax=Kribbella sp. VKM Ac-2571 TaxID=2512222 RepID=UPI001061A139|nr:CGNR zinc finger domain-containing protein [Kribbella sp. VKM Ac-2571]TDO68276.1 putative stress-induced transcription regulator [Kribbella sp. VKM Ac-2571]